MCARCVYVRTNSAIANHYGLFSRSGNIPRAAGRKEIPCHYQVEISTRHVIVLIRRSHGEDDNVKLSTNAKHRLDAAGDDMYMMTNFVAN